MSRLFAETFSLGLKETNARSIGFYYSTVRSEFGERIAQNYEAYVCILIRHFYAEFLKGRRLRVVGVTYDSIDIERAWQHGLKLALQWHCTHVGSYSEKLTRCLAAVDEYSAAYESHRADPVGPPTDPYFSACEHFELHP